jgi:uroporphyrinogen-III synthase
MTNGGSMRSASSSSAPDTAGGASPGVRVLLTRSAEDCAAWAAELERRGIASASLPCITTEIIDSAELRERLEASTREADWIVFTSRRGVEAYGRLLAGELPRRRPLRVAAVGAGTAEAARQGLGRVDLVGEAGTAESLASALIAAVQADSVPPPNVLVLLALAQNAPDTLARALGAAGIACRRFDVYRTVSAEPLTAKPPLASLGVDAVLLASPSAVRGLANRVEIDAASPALVTIGPTTSAAVRKLGLEVAGEAREPTLDALIAALLEAIPRGSATGGSAAGGSARGSAARRSNSPTSPAPHATENSHV